MLFQFHQTEMDKNAYIYIPVTILNLKYANMSLLYLAVIYLKAKMDNFVLFISSFVITPSFVKSARLGLTKYSTGIYYFF